MDLIQIFDPTPGNFLVWDFDRYGFVVVIQI